VFSVGFFFFYFSLHWFSGLKTERSGQGFRHWRRSAGVTTTTTRDCVCSSSTFSAWRFSAGALFSDLCEYQLGPRGLRFVICLFLCLWPRLFSGFPPALLAFAYIFELSFSLLACLLQGQQFPARSCSRVLSVDFYFFWWMIIFPLFFSRSRRQSSDRKGERRREQETEWLTKRTMNTTICSR
jgi:hypothetical protein